MLELVKNMETPMVQDVTSEQALLGALLTNNAALFALPAELRALHFSEPLHQRIFTAITETIERGAPADPLTLKARFDSDPALVDIGGGKYLNNLAVSAAATASVKECANVVIDLALRRRIMSSAYEATQKAADISTGTAREIVSALIAEIENVTAPRYHVSTERQVSERIFDRLKNKKTATVSPTGISGLDAAMEGGLYASKLYGLVGRKKYGKTMMAGTISTNLQHTGVKHLYIALEMGSEEIHQRNLAREFDCYESAFRTGFGESAPFLEKLANYSMNAKNYRIYLDAPGITFSDLRQTLPMFIRKYKITGFILDSWQLVRGKQKGQSDAAHLDDVAQYLAEIVKRHSIWGLVTAQENQDDNTRGGEGIRLACDQLYRMKKRDVSSSDAWLEMMETRYTPWRDVGTENNPALKLNEKGTHFENL